MGVVEMGDGYMHLVYGALGEELERHYVRLCRDLGGVY